MDNEDINEYLRLLEIEQQSKQSQFKHSIYGDERLWVINAEKTLYPFLSKQKYKCATYHLICPLCHRKTICYSEMTVKVIGEGSIVLGMCCDCDCIFLGDNE